MKPIYKIIQFFNKFYIDKNIGRLKIQFYSFAYEQNIFLLPSIVLTFNNKKTFQDYTFELDFVFLVFAFSILIKTNKNAD